MSDTRICPQGHQWTVTESFAGAPSSCPVCDALTVVPVPPPRGQREIVPPPRVPGYEIEGELGRGGMGVVYKARHQALGRVVALKMVQPMIGISGAEWEQLVERFHREARAV